LCIRSLQKGDAKIREEGKNCERATVGAGIPFGAAGWVIADEIVVPALGLSKFPTEYPPVGTLGIIRGAFGLRLHH